VLFKLGMPALDTFANASEGEPPQPQKSQLASEFQTTRENSREPLEDDKKIAPAPMGSLYEATQLGSLRARLRRANPRKRNARRRMEADMVSQNLLSISDAEELLQLYVLSQLQAMHADMCPVSSDPYHGTCLIQAYLRTSLY